MYFESFSDLRPGIYTYLGFSGVEEDARTDRLIQSCLAELEKIAHFRYTHKIYEDPPDFLRREPYASFLRGCMAVAVGVMTLGGETDMAIRRYARTDMERSVVLSATASALLESLSDRFEEKFGSERTYRFCPGYGGSSVEDLGEIFRLLQPEKIGVTLSESYFMLPEKSMAGIVGVGKRARKTCKDCCLLEHCQYRKEGATCYRSEKK
ncbi:MAG: hypothetical protein K2L51_06320 [Clostridiales bacterium]|nr:hypothetical protein [Clostridiales bacterium]